MRPEIKLGLPTTLAAPAPALSRRARGCWCPKGRRHRAGSWSGARVCLGKDVSDWRRWVGRSPLYGRNSPVPVGSARAASAGTPGSRSPGTRAVVVRRASGVTPSTNPRRARAVEHPQSPSSRKQRETQKPYRGRPWANSGRRASGRRPGRRATRPQPPPRVVQRPHRVPRDGKACAYSSRFPETTSSGERERDRASWSRPF